MGRLTLNCWQWLLFGAGCFVVGIVTGPMADRNGYATFPGLLVSLFAFTSGTVCFIVGFIRFVKWIWPPGNSNSNLSKTH
jgi:MFS family permease